MDLAQTIDRFVDRLSLHDLVASFSGRGSTPHRPDLMLKAVLFLCQRGLHKPSQWFRQACENRVVAWLLRGIRPCRARWFAFQARCAPFLDSFNRQLLHQAKDQQLLVVDVPVLDGTLLAANSSRHVLLNQNNLDKRLLQLEQALAADEAAQTGANARAETACGPESHVAESPPDSTAALPQTQRSATTGDARVVADDSAASDAAEPRVGCSAELANLQPVSLAPLEQPTAAAQTATAPLPTKQPGWMAKTTSGRQQQKKRYQKAAKALEERLLRNSKRRKEDRKPPEKVRISLGDPEATLGLDKEKVYRPLYNIQIVCDLKTDFCLAYEVFSGVQDAATLAPMLERIDYFVQEKIDYLMTDCGYATGATLRLLEHKQIQLIAPWQENDYSQQKQAQKGKQQIPKSAFAWDEQKETYRCPEGHELKYLRTETKQQGEQQEKHRQYRCAGEHCQACPRQQECTKNPQAGRMVVRNEYEAEVERHKIHMSSAAAQSLYKKRKEQIERRLADSKEHRGLRKLSRRGQEGARTQVGLTVLANNITIFAKLERAAENAKTVPQRPG
jgi:hypothetical protein